MLSKIFFSAAAVALLSTGAQAGGPCQTCAPCPPAPCVTWQTVYKTVYKPTWVTETRKVNVTKYRHEQREQTVTYYENVPYTKQVTSTHTVATWVDKVRQEKYSTSKPVWKEVPQTYTEYVSAQVKKQGVRKVASVVQETAYHTVCEDQGHWENRSYQVASYAPSYSSCGGCGSCGGCAPACAPACGPSYQTCSYRVWVSNVVQKQVPYTVCKTVWTEQPYDYYVTVCTPVQKTRTVKVCEYVTEWHTRDINYKVCVPQQVTKTHDVTYYKCEARQKTVPVTVCVPYTEVVEVPYQRCVNVPTQVACQVPVTTYPSCGPSYGASYGGGCNGPSCGLGH